MRMYPLVFCNDTMIWLNEGRSYRIKNDLPVSIYWNIGLG